MLCYSVTVILTRSPVQYHTNTYTRRVSKNGVCRRQGCMLGPPNLSRKMMPMSNSLHTRSRELPQKTTVFYNLGACVQKTGPLGPLSGPLNYTFRGEPVLYPQRLATLRPVYSDTTQLDSTAWTTVTDQFWTSWPSEGVYIATRRNSTQLDVELSWVASL